MTSEKTQLADSPTEFEEFLHAAVHDIRGPLGQVRSLTVLLQRQHKDSLNADGQELCTLIESAARRAVEVVEAIHAYSQVLEMPVFETADLNAMVDAACYSLDASIQSSGAAVTRDELPTVCGDRSKLLLLFQELLRNALKFRSEAAPRVHCSAERCFQDEREWILFSMLDNGTGVFGKEPDAIFKPLKRLHGRDHDGAGMGLAICRRIVELHGGRIWVETPQSGGADFRFTLPV